MLKVFLTEDERLVREGLRDMIPWEQYGFVFAGEASDGEMALPLVRKIKPDVVITDIKMPFMDGLAFSRLISKELPATKIIILSGYDDFAYAQQAIELHVDQYLLKPITRASMIQALEQTKARIEEERDQQDYRRRFIRAGEPPGAGAGCGGLQHCSLYPAAERKHNCLQRAECGAAG